MEIFKNKKVKILSFLLLIFVNQTFAQSKDEIAIKKILQDSYDAIFSGGESPVISDYYTADFLLLEHGEVWNIDSIQQYVNRKALVESKPKRVNSFDFITFEIVGDRAYIAFHNYATVTKAGEKPRKFYWLESAEFIRTNNGWRMKLLHSTRVPQKS